MKKKPKVGQLTVIKPRKKKEVSQEHPIVEILKAGSQVVDGVKRIIEVGKKMRDRRG